MYKDIRQTSHSSKQYGCRQQSGSQLARWRPDRPELVCCSMPQAGWKAAEGLLSDHSCCCCSWLWLGLVTCSQGGVQGACSLACKAPCMISTKRCLCGPCKACMSSPGGLMAMLEAAGGTIVLAPATHLADRLSAGSNLGCQYRHMHRHCNGIPDPVSWTAG